MTRVRVKSLTFAFWKGKDVMCLAIPGKIVEIAEGQHEVGIVEVTGVRRRVQLGLLSEDMPVKGDWVLIHVGFAMSKISEVDAAEQMRLLSMLGEIDQAMEEVRGYGTDEDSANREARTRPN
jgi:hydrogenase expression/formation protein HypC